MNKTTLHWSYLNFKDVPMDLYLYEDLEEVYLKENFITIIPKWLLNVTTLKFIHLAGNNLSALPEEMYLLENLEFLDVSNNQITELPQTIGLMLRLQRLNVSGNELQELPTGYCDKTFKIQVIQYLYALFRVGNPLPKYWSYLDFKIVRQKKMGAVFSYPPKGLQARLSRIAAELVAPGKGILAADESKATMDQCFGKIGATNDKETRRQYREIIFTASQKLSDYISGVILHPETLAQRGDNSQPMGELLRSRNIMFGVAIDKSTVSLAGPKSLDDLAARCAKYKEDGCVFAKWRFVLQFSDHTPSNRAIMENANIMGKYAAICQLARMVPIIEPQIKNEGDADLEQAQKTSEIVLAALYKALHDHHVFLEGTLLKMNFITPGKSSAKKYSPGQISLATLKALRRTVPGAVPGITLSANGFSEERSSLILNTINNTPLSKPWPLTFSFSRPLQSSAINVWAGKKENAAFARTEFMKRARANSLACQALGTLKHLEQLNISKNHLKRLPLQLSECTRLNELNLSDNPDVWHIPERISNLPSLQSLSADRCALIYLPVALSKFLNFVRIFHNTSLTHVPMVYEKFFQSFYDNRQKAVPMVVSHSSFFWVLEKETFTKLLLPIGTRRIFPVPSRENQVTLYDDCLRAIQYMNKFMPVYENVALHRLLPEKFMVNHVNNGAVARCTVFTCANPLYTSYYFMIVKRRGSTSKQLFTCNFCSQFCANLWLQDNSKKYYQVDWEICDD